MTTLTMDWSSQGQATAPSIGFAPDEPRGDLISQQVQVALAGAQADRQIERRTETRHPYPYPIHMTPVDRDGHPLVDQTFVVVGKHVSNHGVDFYYAQPVEWSKVIASFNLPEGRWIGLLMELTWCRFSRHGWYDNGGRFVSVVPSPLGNA
ncbi:hypothetical protein NA78x_005042 [Anatilimnocola sp. NA78]|uniref:hypothetical protein n=1 Tax=Anatilimnocola sp. NA78 TaxID=3415683 RepID=UPI003CE54A9A